MDHFNNYFTNIGHRLNVNLAQTGNDPTQFINKNASSFFCTPTYPEEITNIVKKANSKKSSGFGNVDSYIIKQVIPQIANQLAHIFNNSLMTGIVPSKIKIAKVIPLYKSENPELFSNYRPISILPCLSKILERLMYNRLYNFLKEHNIISKKQYGFRKNYSTYMALFDLVDKISSNMNHKKHNIGVFLDLSKAFNTIDHNILINKLQCYSVRDNACNWFKSLITEDSMYRITKQTKNI